MNFQELDRLPKNRNKGSHKRPYVTVWSPLSGSNLEKQKSKARCTLQVQCIYGALAGEQVSNLSERSL